MKDNRVEAILEKFDNNIEKARTKARGQEKVLLNMYYGGK